MGMLVEERIGVFLLFVEIHGEHFEAFRLIFTIDRVERGKGRLAGNAPARPEVDEHNLPLVIRQVHRCTGRTLERDVGCGGPHCGREALRDDRQGDEDWS